MSYTATEKKKSLPKKKLGSSHREAENHPNVLSEFSL